VGLGDIVWDVGSNVGLFAFPAALKASNGRVYTFEPDVDLARNLLRSMMLPHNRKLDVSVLCLAVSNADGTANFEISKFSRAMNKLEGVGDWHRNQVVVGQRRLVPTMRIDTLAKTLPPPTVLKIDVEGAEVSVLEGGEQTIATHRPKILIEGPHELWEPMNEFFDKREYVLFDGSLDSRVPLSQPVWDTVAVPKEIL
jgi:FkbM family methyltransferase